MRTILQITALLSLLATHCWAADPTVSESSVNRVQQRGMFVSASVDITRPVPLLVYTVPRNQDFVLTQICVGMAEGGILLQVNSTNLAHISPGVCQSFTPGMVLPANGKLMCTSFSPTTSFCTITGILGPLNP